MTRFLFLLAVVGAACLTPPPGFADEPLHRRIDALIAAQAGGEVNPIASDADFVRRVYLDLVGRIPNRDEAQSFFDDRAADKRTRLIDRLLGSAEHPERLATVFDVMLLERLGEHPEWRQWLVDSFAANKPWDQMCREMLAPHSEENDPARGAGFFVSKRLENYGTNPVDYPGLVRDVGRLLLGVDLQCAQCHDHLLIDDYEQVDFQGLYAYFANVSLKRDATFPAVVEKPAQKIEFQSVFVSGKHEVGLRLPFGKETEIPAFPAGEEYEIPPDRKTNQPGVPKFSALRSLADELPQADTPGFGKNIVNRLWWMMMGRGLVDPLDLHHSANPPSHPELLDLLASEFAARNFDVRWLVRELALSATYQRDSRLPEGAREVDVPPDRYRVALEKPLSPEQMALSLWSATGPWPDAQPPADLRQRMIKALGQPAREPEIGFAPSVKGALFLSHDAKLLALLARSEGNLIDRLARLPSADAQAEELFLAVLSRRPEAEERALVAEFLAAPADEAADDAGAALAPLVWALVNSHEFCLNH
jgi:hypothetical protein